MRRRQYSETKFGMLEDDGSRAGTTHISERPLAHTLKLPVSEATQQGEGEWNNRARMRMVSIKKVIFYLFCFISSKLLVIGCKIYLNQFSFKSKIRQVHVWNNMDLLRWVVKLYAKQKDHFYFLTLKNVCQEKPCLNMKKTHYRGRFLYDKGCHLPV